MLTLLNFGMMGYGGYPMGIGMSAIGSTFGFLGFLLGTATWFLVILNLALLAAFLVRLIEKNRKK